MPKEAHPPWSSPLWDHLEEIRSLRRARRTWQAIAERLGAKLTPAGVRIFFIRASNPKQKRPIGWESPVSVNQSVKAPMPAGRMGSTSQQAREAARKSRLDFQARPQEPLIRPYKPPC